MNDFFFLHWCSCSLFCLKKASPFIFTKVNSLGPVEPSPTTDTNTASPGPDSTEATSPVPDSTGSPGSDSTEPTSTPPAPTTPSDPECPSDLPVWVPVVAGVGGLVVGVAVAGIVFSCFCQKKKEAYLMEMKGTGF